MTLSTWHMSEVLYSLTSSLLLHRLNLNIPSTPSSSSSSSRKLLKILPASLLTTLCPLINPCLTFDPWADFYEKIYQDVFQFYLFTPSNYDDGMAI